ncbi:hypothetical protein [Thermoflexibacter ruber]|uniref:hypothetical protein n=1 Tax=Thermoflexibacter ruber TaxID=1003 RepID=UPI001160A746|nr:hypothetical protein [Thermoflexibacter ruber]
MFIVSCISTSKDPEQEYINFKKFLQEEVKLRQSSKNRYLIFLLREENCSCKEANLHFVNKIIENNTDFDIVIIVKKEKDSKIQNAFTAKDRVLTYFEDETKLLEKHGNIFVVDKVFVLENEKLTRVFHLDKEHYEDIEKFLNVADE